jgi:hypothetical protein
MILPYNRFPCIIDKYLTSQICPICKKKTLPPSTESSFNNAIIPTYSGNHTLKQRALDFVRLAECSVFLFCIYLHMQSVSYSITSAFLLTNGFIFCTFIAI